MGRITRKGTILFVLVALVLLGATPVMAAFPDKPITLVTWSSVGGGGDVLGRHLQGPLSKVAGVPVVIVNKPGGSGAVAMEYAKSNFKPDGYELLITTASGVITPHVAGSRLSVADFKGVIRVQLDPEVYMVRSDSPFKTVTEAFEAAKAKPGSVKFAGAFLGTLDSLLTYQISQQFGIPFSYLPFNGGGEAMTALLGGHVDVLCGNPSEVMGQVEAGKIRLIGIGTTERVPDLPDVPTLKEQGIDIEAVLWRGIVAPTDTPDERVEKLNGLIKKAMEDPKWKEYMKNSNLLPGYQTPAQFDKSIKAEFERYGKIVEAMGVKKKK